ncbi:MAG TPA: M6 family metalloprotease domain-containing protein [Longimicrobiales bacterium]
MAGAGPARAQLVRPSLAEGAPVAPPVEIAGLDARPMVPLEFSRAWLAKAERVRRVRAELRAAGELDGAAPEALVGMGAALAGTLRVPVIPVRYADVAAPFGVEVLEGRLFGPVRGDTVSYAAYWREVSGGLLRVEGEVAPWVELERPARHYLESERYAWASFGRIVEFRRDAIRAADEHVDFGRFDNDGPDGVPNSGDDDGFVDFVALLYATACTGEWRDGAIWPHRGAMEPIETGDAAAGGGRIKVADYVILPATQAGTCDPLHIGVLAHETGHALGLPDLYDYDGSSQGIGAWGLMGTGSHSERYSPAHLSAWSKEQLGWVRVEWLTESRDSLRIPPVLESRTVYRYDIPGTRDEYLLFENRQKRGSDRGLPGSGLLIWRVAPDRGELGAWNGDEAHPAVGLVEADGRRDLRRGRLAGPGDPFPGYFRKDVFELGGEPPLRLSAIRERDGVITADVAIGFTGPTLVASPAEVRLTAAPGDGRATRLVAVRRAGGGIGSWSARPTAPWLETKPVGDMLALIADADGLEFGLHADTVQLYLDGAASEAPVGRVVVEFDVVAPGEPEVVATGLPWGWGLAARAGRIYQASYGWDPLGLRPRPRVLHLPDADRHLETLARLPAEALYAPVPAPGGGVYILARALDRNYLYRVWPDGRAEVVAAVAGSTPAYGAAALRDGSVLVADWSGRIRRVTRDGAVEPWTALNVGIYQIAVDSLATIYAAAHSGDVLRVNGDGTVDVIPTGFGTGGLVAVAAAPSGEVFAAERGGAGRILRIEAGRPPEEIARFEGAEFYGLTVDGPFLYALDLRGRQLLRFPLTGGTAADVTADVEAAPSGSDAPPPEPATSPAGGATPPVR